MDVQIVKELNGYGAEQGGSACLVQRGDDYFVISSIPAAPDHGGPETLAFASDENGEVTVWTDVAGGRGWTREKTIAELDLLGPDADSLGRGIFGDTKKLDARDGAEQAAGLIASMGVIAKEMSK